MSKLNYFLLYFVTFVSILFVSAVTAQSTYTQVYSGNSYDEGVAAFRLPNNEIRLLGNTGSFGDGNTDVWLIALDSSANFLWHKYYGGTQIELIQEVVMTPEGDLFMVGSTTQNTSKSYQVYFLGLDQYGQIISYNNFGGTDWDFGYGLCQVDDSSFVLVGETYSMGAGEGDVYVLKVKRKVELIWEKSFGGAKNDYVNTVELMPDGGFFLGGSSSSFGSGSMDAYLLRLNEYGDSIWTQVNTSISDAEVYDAVINPDTSIMVCGYRKDSLNLFQDIDLMKYNQSGSFLWSAYHSLSEGESSYMASILREQSGEYLMAGKTTRFGTSGSENALITRTYSSGWWKAAENPGSENDDYGSFITSDNFHGQHYFMVGTTKSYNVNQSGIFFVRLDSNLYYDTTRQVNFPTSIEQNTTSVEDGISIYPNPVRDNLRIKLKSDIGNFNVKVYNIFGNLVYSQSYNRLSEEIEIDVSNLSKGLYTLLISAERDVYSKQVVVL